MGNRELDLLPDLLRKRRKPRDGGEGGKGIKCVMNLNQLIMMKVIITYCKCVLIKNKKHQAKL